MITINRNSPQEAQKALATVMELESGKFTLDLWQYKKAIEVLKGSDIESFYLKLPPRLSPKIIEAIKLARQIYRRCYGPSQATKLIATVLKLNRKLSNYGQDEPWAEEMNIAAIMSQARPYPFFTRQYLKNNFKLPLFSKESVNMIAQFIFDAPDMTRVFFTDNDVVINWKIKVIKFLEELSTASVPVILIFCAIEIDTLYLIKKELKRKSKNAWKHGYFSQEDQLWYFGKIVETLSRLPADKNIEAMLEEYRSVSLEIFQMLKKKKTESVSVS